jgi:hypothetical protein
VDGAALVGAGGGGRVLVVVGSGTVETLGEDPAGVAVGVLGALVPLAGPAGLGDGPGVAGGDVQPGSTASTDVASNQPARDLIRDMSSTGTPQPRYSKCW